MPGLPNSVNHSGVRVVVAGDSRTGKTNLVNVATIHQVPETLASNYDRVPISIIDTSSRPQTFQNLTTFWFPRLRQLQVKVPIIVVRVILIGYRQHRGYLRYLPQQVSLQQAMSPLMQQFCEIEAYIECSPFRRIQVFETLTPQCARALERIFILCDHDRDGALSNAEVNYFQIKCFSGPLQPWEISDVKKFVQENLSEGVNERGLTLAGFVFLHTFSIKEGPLETTWTVLGKFGYNGDIKLANYFISPLKRAPDQSVELTNEAIDFLKKIFEEFDGDSDKVLQPHELEELFSTALESPWIENPYMDAIERNALGGLSLDAFLSKWTLMTLLNPTFVRHADRNRQHSERNVLQCFVFGPMKAGKSALLNSLIGRPYFEAYSPTNEDRYAVNVVDISRENKKYLVLREISEDGVTKLLANEESLASCDIAVFVHDRSDKSSWKASSELLLKITGHGEDTGFQVPYLIVAAKDEQNSFTMAIQETTMVFFINLFFCTVIYIVKKSHIGCEKA
ncbi:mitochondrial Rho GTPase [Trifolium repens]|nr:mitochondrial Rho GTPase [Trifolium repens]